MDELNEECFGLPFLEKGIITMSWFNGLGSGLNPLEEIFTLKFRANKSGRLSEVFDLNSNLIKSEIYNDGSVKNLDLIFENQNIVFE